MTKEPMTVAEWKAERAGREIPTATEEEYAAEYEAAFAAHAAEKDQAEAKAKTKTNGSIKKLVTVQDREKRERDAKLADRYCDKNGGTPPPAPKPEPTRRSIRSRRRCRPKRRTAARESDEGRLGICGSRVGEARAA